MQSEIDLMVALALETGAVSDASSPIQSVKPAEPKPPESGAAWRPPQHESFTYEPNLKMSERPLGVLVARSLHAEGHFSDQDLEAVIELSRTPEQFILNTDDSDRALELIGTYVQHKMIDQNQALQLAEVVAHRETRKELEETARLESEDRREREVIESKTRELDRKEELQSAIRDRYYATIDRLQNAQTEASQ